MPKILGISGSPRKESTEFAVHKALDKINEFPKLETEFWSVRGKNIEYCIHCDRCIKNQEHCFIEDDIQELTELVLEADGYLIGSPVYNMNVTAQLAACFNRLRPLFVVEPGSFSYKVGAGISLGGTRHGGQEQTLNAIINFYLMHSVLVIGGIEGCYSGGTVWTKDKKIEGVKSDEPGKNTIEGVSKALAEAAIISSEGREKLKNLKEKNDIEGNMVVQDHNLWEN